MDSPRVVSAEEWLAARTELLAKEKKVTHAKDAVDAARRELPMTEVTKDYRFISPAGEVSLADLFEGRRQLVIYHFMWRHAGSGFPGEDQGCPTCSFLIDSVGNLSHLHASDTTLALVSRAPIGSIERFRQRMGWNLPWYSSHGSDFNYDFHASFDEDITPVSYNYMSGAELERALPWIQSGGDGGGASVFLRDGTRVFHTYSAYTRGVEQLFGTYQWLDLTPLGRQRHVAQIPHHDAYQTEPE
jgi:predicted dithiol-disulfide oxidoreductase (DUF899 family)